ncbi:MAG: alkaline phosphatase family protein, partial [Anaerolineaceae bacterium]
LAPSILEKFDGRYKKVVLVLVDALGFSHFQRMMEAGRAEFWRENLDKANLFPITSVSPSTTSSALTTLWTGTAPNQHGYIGYEMWLKELSMVINTILQTPTSFAGDMGGLSRAGFDPESFLGIRLLGEQFAPHGIESHAFMPYTIGNSGLSRMHLSQTILHGYVAESDLWANLRDTLNARPNHPRFLYVYWNTLDTLIHRYGPDDERVTNQFADFSRALQINFFDGLEDWTRKDTLLLLTADHGAITTPPDDTYNLSAYPELASGLRILPTNESRLPFLYLKPGMERVVREEIEAAWLEKFSVITGEEAIAMHLFGNGADHPGLTDRVGDLVMIPHGSAYLWWPNRANTMQGRHGGLNPDEMLIPLYALPLG